MDHIIVTQSQASDSVDSSVLTAADTPATSHHRQQQQQRCDGGAHVSVKLTVKRLLGRLGLSQLTPLVDRTVVSQPDTASIQVTPTACHYYYY